MAGQVNNTIKYDGEVNLAEYDNYFQKNFIETSEDYYRQQADLWLGTMNAIEYVRTASDRIEKEIDKADKFMQQITKQKLA